MPNFFKITSYTPSMIIVSLLLFACIAQPKRKSSSDEDGVESKPSKRPTTGGEGSIDDGDFITENLANTSITYHRGIFPGAKVKIVAADTNLINNSSETILLGLPVDVALMEDERSIDQTALRYPILVCHSMENISKPKDSAILVKDKLSGTVFLLKDNALISSVINNRLLVCFQTVKTYFTTQTVSGVLTEIDSGTIIISGFKEADKIVVTRSDQVGYINLDWELPPEISNYKSNIAIGTYAHETCSSVGSLVSFSTAENNQVAVRDRYLFARVCITDRIYGFTSPGRLISLTPPESDENGRTSDGHILFVSSTVHTGNLGGRNGANRTCKELAKDVGLSGAFVAFLSTTDKDAADIINGSNRKIFNTKGQELFANPEVMCALAGPLNEILTQKKEEANPLGWSVWTGSGTTCLLYPTDNLTCSDYTSDDVTAGPGISGRLKAGNEEEVTTWIHYTGYANFSTDCTQRTTRIYCISL